MLRELYAEVDRMKGKVTFIALERGGWKAVVTGVGLPPHTGIGLTGPEALDEVLRFARRVGATR